MACVTQALSRFDAALHIDPAEAQAAEGKADILLSRGNLNGCVSWYVNSLEMGLHGTRYICNEAVWYL